jgi:hypothetical protein
MASGISKRLHLYFCRPILAKNRAKAIWQLMAVKKTEQISPEESPNLLREKPSR